LILERQQASVRRQTGNDLRINSADAGRVLNSIDVSVKKNFHDFK
jgi:hypothetical protein